jgi:type III restriction enzyme
VAEKAAFEITWPNVVRIENVFRPRLSLDWGRISPLQLDASRTAHVAELAPVIGGKPDLSKISPIALEELASKFRTQRIIFEAARDVYDQMQKDWKGSKPFLIAQVVRLVEDFIASDKLSISPSLFASDPTRRRLVITLNMTKVVQHIWEAIRFENVETATPVFDRERPVSSTADMGAWFTGKPCEPTKRSHVNFSPFDSTWESSEAYVLDTDEAVDAWVKNDHLGFEIAYVFHGVVRKYRPDFIIRLKTGELLVLEVKGKDAEQDRTKRRFLAEWVAAVNSHGGFGRWRADVSLNTADIKDTLARHLRA